MQLQLLKLQQINGILCNIQYRMHDAKANKKLKYLIINVSYTYLRNTKRELHEIFCIQEIIWITELIKSVKLKGAAPLKSCIMACTNSENSDQSGHGCS